jgi:membrane associated rhomboid family serine protease
MFPIKDTIRSRSFPLVTWAIIISNILLFFFELSLSPSGLSKLIRNYGLIANQISLSNPLTWFPFVSHMFLHGGWFHLLSNLWTLFIFGDNVEDRMGSFRFLIFYLFGGIGAGLMQVFLGAANVPSIGASGAIAAVLGAYFVFFPRAKVITLIPIFIIPWFIDIPALIFIGFWFVSQLFSGLLSLAGSAANAGIAWWAHIGGFLIGLVLAFPFTLGRRNQRWYRDEYYPW